MTNNRKTKRARPKARVHARAPLPALPLIERPAFAELPAVGFVRLPTVLSVFPVSKSTWWAGVKSGKYPAPVKLSKNVTAWLVEDLQREIAKLGRPAPAPPDRR